MKPTLWIRCLVTASLLLGTTPGHALDISAVFNLGLSDFANGVRAVHAPNDIEVDLTPGDIVALDIVVENAPRDAIEAIVASLVVDDDQVRLLGGGFAEILSEGSCTGFGCRPASLRPVDPAPTNKLDSPRSRGTGTEQWVRALLHSIPGGTTGTGPDVAVLLGLTVQDVGARDRIDFTMALTGVDEISSPNGSRFPGTVHFSDAVINVPEPSAALLLGLGLFGLGWGAGTAPRTRLHRGLAPVVPHEYP